MKPTGVDHFVLPDKGGLIRDPDFIASHLQPGAGPVAVTAELRFRRAFQTVMDAKGWHEPDIMMEQAHATQ